MINDKKNLKTELRSDQSQSARNTVQKWTNKVDCFRLDDSCTIVNHVRYCWRHGKAVLWKLAMINGSWTNHKSRVYCGLAQCSLLTCGQCRRLRTCRPGFVPNTTGILWAKVIIKLLPFSFLAALWKSRVRNERRVRALPSSLQNNTLERVEF